MGKNSKTNKNLLNKYLKYSNQELSLYINYKVKEYLIYKTSCYIAQEILYQNGYTRKVNFGDNKLDFEYLKLIRISELRSIKIEISEEEIIVTKIDVIKRLNTICCEDLKWIDEYNYLFDTNNEHQDVEVNNLNNNEEYRSDIMKQETYNFFTNIINNLNDEMIEELTNKLSNKSLKKYLYKK